MSHKARGVLMGNHDFENGVEHGHEDRAAGKGNCLASRSLKRALSLDQLLPGAENRHDQYRGGYVKGQTDDLTWINVASGATMGSQIGGGKGGCMSADSIERQLQMLHVTKENLKALKKHIGELRDQYKSQINHAENNGFFSNATKVLSKHHSVFSSHIDELKDMLGDQYNELGEQEEKLRRLRDFIQDNG